VVNLAVLPLTFISNIWFPTDTLPSALQRVADVFPIKALADGLQHAFDPRRSGMTVSGHDLRTLAIWTVVGMWLMYRFLRQPQGEVA
jgi:ABC-type multidrug transport system permease subunit